jgi:hypothetical protein
MASLTGNLIKDTYQSLLKIIDNGNATSTAKEITDGEGNSIGVSVDTSGNVTANGTLQGSTVTDGTTSISDLQANKQETSEKGAASGYAPLDSNSKVPIANIPDSVLGQLEYKGTWDANNDSPALPSASGVKGNYYVVSVAGVYEAVDYEVGDWIVSNGTIWEKVDNSDKVSSVNGATGAVVLDTDNISEGSTNQYYTSDRANSDFDTRLATKNTGDLTEGSNLYYTEDRVSANTDVAANTAKTGISTEQSDAIIANTAKNTYPPEDATKLLGIEAGANVTDVANVTTALNSISIKELDDVSSTSPSNNQVLQFNSTSGEYEPSTIDTGGSVDSVNGQTGVVSLGLLELDDVGADGTSGQVLTTDGLGSFTFTTVSGGGGAVDSVNGQTGTVVLDTDDISEGTNKYTTAANLTKLGNISVTQAVDLDTMESDIATNNSKVGISTQQAADIVTNNAKVSYPSTDSTKVGFISITQDVDLDTIESDVATNNAKVGITAQQTSDILTNNAKIGITTQQANDITANNSKVSMVLGTTAGTALEGDTELLQLGTTSTTALAGDTTTITAQQAADISTNNSKVGITTAQADAIVVNTAKVGITAQQSSDITTNNAKISYPSTDSTKVGFISVTQAVDLDTIENDVAVNNAKTGITTQQAADIVTNNAKISFDSTSSTKLGTIAEGAEVNVNADWNATTGDAFIQNKPTLSTVATSGAYSDLSGTPSLATVATSGSYTDLTNQPTIPTNNNQLINGAGYTTNIGDITGVTVGTGLDGGGTSGSVTVSLDLTEVTTGVGLDTTTTGITLDLSEFLDMTADMVDTDEFIVLDGGFERRKAANEIESTILNLEKQSNAIGNAIDFSARVTLDGGVAEGTSTMIKNLQNII